MNETEQQLRRANLRWLFWFAVAATAFLVVTFIWFLPLRFLYQAGIEHEGESAMHDDTSVDGDHSGATLDHESSGIHQGLSVDVNFSPAPMVGSATWLDFFVNEKPAGTPISLDRLEIEHEKLMHVIGIRSDMEEFFHIHPMADPSSSGHLMVPHMFTAPGIYKLWTEVKQDGVIHSIGQPEFAVAGEGSQSAKSVSFARNVITGNYQVSLAVDEPVGKQREVDLTFDVHTLVGGEVEVDDYLGAAMHLAVIKDDWTQFIHTHPEEAGHPHASRQFISRASAHGETTEETAGAGDDHGITFHVTFPEAGLYKTFAQFRPHGTDLESDEALTAAFWIRVEEQPPLISNWWLRLVVSFGLILLLSWVVRRYLEAPVARSKS